LTRHFEPLTELGYPVLESFLSTAKSSRIEQAEELIKLNELLFEIGCHKVPPPVVLVQHSRRGTTAISPIRAIALSFYHLIEGYLLDSR
jgi:hypothetical protein